MNFGTLFYVKNTTTLKYLKQLTQYKNYLGILKYCCQRLNMYFKLIVIKKKLLWVNKLNDNTDLISFSYSKIIKTKLKFQVVYYLL